MDLLKYLKIIGDLPDPKRSLSSCVQPQEIAQANKKVRKAIKSMSRNVDLIGYTVQIYKLKLVKMLVIIVYCSSCFFQIKYMPYSPKVINILHVANTKG